MYSNVKLFSNLIDKVFTMLAAARFELASGMVTVKTRGASVSSRIQPQPPAISADKMHFQNLSSRPFINCVWKFLQTQCIFEIVAETKETKFAQKITKKRALLKSIFVIPIRVSFFQFLQHKILLKMKIYFATKILWKRVTLTWQKLPQS